MIALITVCVRGGGIPPPRAAKPSVIAAATHHVVIPTRERSEPGGTWRFIGVAKKRDAVCVRARGSARGHNPDDARRPSWEGGNIHLTQRR